MNETKKVWLISDTHFLHKNIIKYCNRPENHDDVMIKNWNDTVNETDLIIHLGDISAGLSKVMNGEGVLIDIFKELKGTKVLIRGNHDHFEDDWYIKNLGFTSVTDYLSIDGFFLCHYPLITTKYSSDKEIQTIKFLKEEFKKSGCHTLIHGHSHQTIFDGKINVAVDLNNFSPVSFDDIYEKYSLIN